MCRLLVCGLGVSANDQNRDFAAFVAEARNLCQCWSKSEEVLANFWGMELDAEWTYEAAIIEFVDNPIAMSLPTSQNFRQGGSTYLSPYFVVVYSVNFS